MQQQYSQQESGTLAFSQSSDTSPSNILEQTPNKTCRTDVSRQQDLNSGGNFTYNSDVKRLQESDLVNVEGGMYSDYKLTSHKKISNQGRKMEKILDDTPQVLIEELNHHSREQYDLKQVSQQQKIEAFNIDKLQESQKKLQNYQSKKIEDEEDMLKINYDSIFTDRTNRDENMVSSPSSQSMGQDSVNKSDKLIEELDKQKLENEQLAKQNILLLQQMREIMISNNSSNASNSTAKFETQNNTNLENRVSNTQYQNLQSCLINQNEINENHNQKQEEEFSMKKVQIYTDDYEEYENEQLRIGQMSNNQNDGSLKEQEAFKKTFTRNNSHKIAVTVTPSSSQPNLKQNFTENKASQFQVKTITHTRKQSAEGTNFTFCNTCNHQCQCQNELQQQQKQDNNLQSQHREANTTSDQSSNISKKFVSLKKMAFSPPKQLQNIQIDTKPPTTNQFTVGPRTTLGLPPQSNNNSKGLDNHAKTTKNHHQNIRQLPLQQNNSLPASQVNSARSGHKNTGSTSQVRQNTSLSQGNTVKPIQNRRTSSQSNFHEKNYIRNMLQNSVLSSNEDKIDFLVSEIETANTKISMLQDHLQNLGGSAPPNVNYGNMNLDIWVSEKKHLLDQIQNLKEQSYKSQQESISLKDENSQLRVLVTRRTEEANQTILKLAQQNQEFKSKNEEYLVLIEQLSNEIIKASNQNQQIQQQYQQVQLQNQQLIQVIQTMNQNQMSMKSNQLMLNNNEEYDRLRQENIQLGADLKAMNVRFEEMIKEKSILEQQIMQSQLSLDNLNQLNQQKDETIKKLKKKIVGQYIKEKIWNNQIGYDDVGEVDLQQEQQLDDGQEDFNFKQNQRDLQLNTINQQQHEQHKLNMMSALFSPLSTIASQNNNQDDNFSSINGDFLSSQANYNLNSKGFSIGNTTLGNNNANQNNNRRFFQTNDFSLNAGKQQMKQTFQLSQTQQQQQQQY
ncbi:UNKNOWN [Stylonychia lemnae]|uniref:Uncharacterized protein n=1 Tax=Stylonychia lemnae TaxID=5949 RepID=A0A078B7I6_STYLE|nr:UNKNOWN [Stylonychia lemnae]|eukprot:CDW89503.1 UNKNOWN [Stylonychia lemnae]